MLTRSAPPPPHLQPRPSTSGSRILPRTKSLLYVFAYFGFEGLLLKVVRLSLLQEEMAAASLDQNFTEELSAIEQCTFSSATPFLERCD